jgi:hypothetical protein
MATATATATDIRANQVYTKGGISRRIVSAGKTGIRFVSRNGRRGRYAQEITKVADASEFGTGWTLME